MIFSVLLKMHKSGVGVAWMTSPRGFEVFNAAIWAGQTVNSGPSLAGVQ